MSLQCWQHHGPFEPTQTWDKPSVGGTLCSMTLNTLSILNERKLRWTVAVTMCMYIHKAHSTRPSTEMLKTCSFSWLHSCLLPSWYITWKSMRISKGHESSWTPCNQNVEWSNVPRLLTSFPLNKSACGSHFHFSSTNQTSIFTYMEPSTGPGTNKSYFEWSQYNSALKKRKDGNMKDICCVGLSPGPHWNREKLWWIK